MTNWANIADQVCTILAHVDQHGKRYATEARKRGIDVHQLTAAAITSVVRECVEGPGHVYPDRPRRR